MITMMEHPKHGRHPAQGHEIEPMKAHGWTVRAPKVAVPPDPASEPEVVPASPEQPRQKRAYNRKQG
jgi:hypothetical protein